MCENRTPFLSLDQANSEGPGKMHDLNTVLARHSLMAWSDYQGSKNIRLALEVSHDGEHWYQLGGFPMRPGWPTQAGWPHLWEQNFSDWAWPARYVRARVTAWPEDAAGSHVSATVASALPGSAASGAMSTEPMEACSTKVQQPG